MGCGNSKAESPKAQAELPTMLRSPVAQSPQVCKPSANVSELSSNEPEPTWKARQYNKELSRRNRAVLAASTSALEKLQADGIWGTGDVLEAVDPVFHHYYGIINAGMSCPFMSAEEVVDYFKLTAALCPRLNKDSPETVGGASQIHALCEIFEFLDEKAVPVDSCDTVFMGGTVCDLVNTFHEIMFPRWVQARIFKSDTAGKACLVTGRKWGLEKSDAYQAALERLLRNAEGVMLSRYDDDNNCYVTGKASRVGQVVRINFQYTGNKAGPADKHDPKGSVIGWEEDDGVKTILATNVHIFENTDTTIVGSMEFRSVPATVPDRELWFRFSGDEYIKNYQQTYLNFDHPEAMLLPSYWNRSILFPQIVSAGCGLTLRKSENVFKHLMGIEHQSEVGENYMAYNMFSTQGLQQSELSHFQNLFDASFRKKFTRDRKDGGVPDRLLITRGHRCQNVQNWTEYSRRRWQIKEKLQDGKGLLRSIDNLKTSGVLPALNEYQLDPDSHEEFLFHGTNDAAAASITKGDFLVNLAGSNAGTLYGRGVYLAESVSKSDEYTKENASGERCILVCRAALGYVNYNDEVAPNVDDLVKSCTDGPYHCVVGDREKCRGTYREIIVYDDDQVYPEYIIWYKRVYNDH